MFKKILLGLLVIAAGVLGVASFQPDNFKVERSIVINRPAEAIFVHVNTLKSWEAWSPWAKLDPNAKLTYEGPASGVGASYSWTGNNEVGEGRSTITASQPNTSIQFKLEMLKPFAATNAVEFTFTPQNNNTQVTWSMSGTNNLLSKIFGLVFNCDKMVGGQFEKGLDQLKSVVEGENLPPI